MNQYNNYYSSSNSEEFAIICAIMYVIIGIGLVCWLLEAFAMYRLAKRANATSPWYAFIPFAHAYQKITLPAPRPFDILGIVHTYDRSTVAICYLIAPLVCTILGCIPVLGYLITFVYSVLILIVKWRINYDLFWVFGKKEPALVLSILGLFIPGLSIVYLLIISFGDSYNLDEDSDLTF